MVLTVAVSVAQEEKATSLIVNEFEGYLLDHGLLHCLIYHLCFGEA